LIGYSFISVKGDKTALSLIQGKNGSSLKRVAPAIMSRFIKVNFTGKKHDLGFSLMNQLSVAEKRFPRAHQDIAADYFALRKVHTGTRWTFTEGRNTAWAGTLSTHAHTERKSSAGGCVLMDDGSVWHSDRDYKSAEHNLLWSNDPAIWRPLRF